MEGDKQGTNLEEYNGQNNAADRVGKAAFWSLRLPRIALTRKSHKIVENDAEWQQSFTYPYKSQLRGN